MANLGLITAMALGAIVALSAPVLVWGLVVTGIRQMKKAARSEGQRDLAPGNIEA